MKILILHFHSCLWTVAAVFAPPGKMCSYPPTLRFSESHRRVKTVCNPSAYPLYPFQNVFHFCIFPVILKSNNSLAPLERQIQWEIQLSFKAGDLVRHSNELNSIYTACNLTIIFLPLFISFLYDVKKMYKTPRQTLMMCSSCLWPLLVWNLSQAITLFNRCISFLCTPGKTLC